MALNIPKIAERTNVFKNSPKINQVLKNQGGRNVPKSDTDTTYVSGDFDHNQLNNFIAKKHRAWEDSIGENVHANNYTDTLPTKEFYAPSVASEMSLKGDFITTTTQNGTGFANVTFKCPYDFTSITSAEIIAISSFTNANANIDLWSDYGAVGENYNQHSQSNTASTYNLTADKIFIMNISSIISSMAADDYVGIKIVKQDAGTISVIGFRLRYT